MGFQLDRLNRLSYPAQVQRQALAQLVAGRLNPGDRLPSVRQLARDLKISRTTAERIQDVLCETMLAEVRPRSGAYAASPTAPGSGGETLHVQQTYDFLKRTVLEARQLGLDTQRLTQLVGAFQDDTTLRSTARLPTLPLIATRDTFECMVQCLDPGFPARLEHLPPTAQASEFPQAARYLLSGYYLRGRARKIADEVGCSLVYIRYNVKLLEEAMAIPAGEFRHFLTRDHDNAETTRVFLASAYPEIPVSQYSVHAASEWLDRQDELDRGGAIWFTITAAPLLENRVAGMRLRVLHPLLAEDFIDELRCLALLG
jgi:DNA-binding transcriptional regulator YhcF (GntR family)